MTTRKHAFYGILALVSLLTLGITQSARANLIINCEFETGDFTDWTTTAGPGETAFLWPTGPELISRILAVFRCVSALTVRQHYTTVRPPPSYTLPSPIWCVFPPRFV